MRIILFLNCIIFSLYGYVYSQNKIVSRSCAGVLINGVCWAEYNVDEPGTFANPAKPYGMLYQWNRRKGWPAITPENVSGWDSSLEPGYTWEPANDPCPAGWRMPTFEEIKSLTDEAKVTYTEQAGQDRVLGSRYTDITTGNTLFLPIAGYRDNQGARHNVLWVHYWSGTDYWRLDRYGASRYPYAYGYSVRCVADENACDIVLTTSENICKEALPYIWHDTTFREGTVTGEYCIRRTNPVSRCDTIFYLYLTVDTLCGKPCKERGTFINGVCWAESNVDNPNTFADTPEAFGLLYQWNRKKGYSLKENIDPDDWMSYDSYVRWEVVNNPCPADWRIPSIGDICMLLDEERVTRKWTQQNGVTGMRFTDKFNGNMVFFPAAGFRADPWPQPSIEDDECGFYWSTTKEYNDKAVWNLVFWSEEWVHTDPIANSAVSVRCVAGRDTTGCVTVITDAYDTICSNALPYTWCDTTFDVGTVSGVYRFQRISTVTGCDSIVNLYLTVDECGTSCPGVLINGVCWAKSNVDEPGTFAATPEASGMLYQWNRRKGWLATGEVSGWDSSVPSGESWEIANDPCPAGWRVPNLEEINALLDNTEVTSEWILQNGVYGRKFTDNVTGNTIFLPEGTMRDGGLVASNYAGIWSNASGSGSTAWLLFSHSTILARIVLPRALGFPVRCIVGRDTTGCITAVTNTSVTVCVNDLPYTWCDTTFGIGTESGMYSFRYVSTVTGCDSIINLHLTVHASASSFFDAVCSGSSYDKHGFSLPVVYRDTVIHDTLQSVWGCDSVRTLYLTVNPEYNTPLYDTVCRGASYNLHGFSLSNVQTDGTYTLPLSSRAGCDSTLTLHLKVHPVYDTILYDTVCQGDGYYKYGFSLSKGTLGGTFSKSYLSIHGCDSTVTLNLHVWPTYFNSQTKDICSGDTIDFRGHKLYESGVYYDSLTTVHGCDSVFSMTLEVYPVYAFPFSGSVCYGSSYNNYGFSLPAVYRDTIVRDTFKTRWGCDSLRTLYLTVRPVYDTILYDTVCQGDGYYRYGFSLSKGTLSGTFTQSYRSIHGCDSIVTLNLHVWPTFFNSQTKDICSGDTVDFRGRRLYRSGVYYDSLKTVHGCDSIYRMTLTVHSTAPSYIPDVVCYCSGYHKYGFHLPAVYRDTVFRDTFQSVWGCDSIRILSLNVRPVYDTPLYDTVCQGDDYRSYGFSLSNVQKDGVYTLPLFSRDGCDSVLTLHLKVHPVYNTILYDSVCPSARYIRHGFHLSDIRESGTYRRPLHSVHGCDSIVTLNLYVWPTYFYPHRENICEGDTFDFRGRRLYENGTYYDSLTTVHGCDSVYCLYLTVHPVYDVRLSGILCEGTTYNRYGFSVTTPGEHCRYLKTVAGCDSTVLLTLTEEKKVDGSISVLLEDCSLHGYSFFFDPVVPQSAWLWDMGDGKVFRSEEGYHTYADSGLYRIQLRLETSGGCENLYSYVQYVPPYLPEIPIRANRLLIDEDYPTVHFRVDVLPGMRCEWDFGDGATGVGDSVSHTYDVRSEKYYDVLLKVFNADSCVTESRAQIEVAFFPKALNTFSPNGDGINDVFMGDYRIEIINRNGLRIYTGDNGWDGTYNGSPAPVDTYFYRLYYRTALGERMKTGYVTLIR